MGAWRQRQPPPPAEPEEDPGAWVRGGPVPELPAGTRIAAVDPGRKSTFTAAVYETTAQPLWQQLQQVQAGVSGQGTHQVGPLAPFHSRMAAQLGSRSQHRRARPSTSPPSAGQLASGMRRPATTTADASSSGGCTSTPIWRCARALSCSTI